MSYLFHLLISFQIYAIVAMSLNLLIGYGGLLQIAHAAYFGVGAYTAALLWTQFGVGFVPGLLAASLMAGVLSLLVSLPAWRFRGDYFVMVSLAAQVLLYSVMYNWVSITNGPFGITGIPKPSLFGSTIDSDGIILAIYSAVFGLMGLIIAAAKLSPFGRSLQAMRDDELAARCIGIPVQRLKVESFALASGLVGVAGALYAAFVSYIDPTSFNMDASILMLSMVIVGGTGNVRGPLVGAAVLIAIPELLRFLQLPDSVAANLRLLAYGLLLIVLMHWRPQGLAGRYRFE